MTTAHSLDFEFFFLLTNSLTQTIPLFLFLIFFITFLPYLFYLFRFKLNKRQEMLIIKPLPLFYFWFQLISHVDWSI